MVRAAHLRHLARRFVGSLDPRGPEPSEESWACDHLLDGERMLWRRMSGPDRRHAVAVARRVVAALASPEVDRPVIAAALLHDVGKTEAAIGTFGRAAVTAAALVAGHDRIARLAGRGRAGRYLRHDEIGAGLLRDAGSDPLTVAWAAEHHRPQRSWTVPAGIGLALKAADDD